MGRIHCNNHGGSIILDDSRVEKTAVGSVFGKMVGSNYYCNHLVALLDLKFSKVTFMVS